MSFPQTRLTVVERLASGGSGDDWEVFFRDYWGPVCRFAAIAGAPTTADAEDVASQTFEVLWRNRLLARWASNRSARLRSLLCAVARKILANRRRTRAAWQPGDDDLSDFLASLARQDDDSPADRFYAAWVEELVARAVESLALKYHREGKGDYVRVLYGRLCEGATIADVAAALQITPASVDNYYRHARDRLSQKLEELLRRHVARYCPAGEIEAELADEWRRLGRHLMARGGLEEAVRAAHAASAAEERSKTAMQEALTRLTVSLRAVPDPSQDPTRC